MYITENGLRIFYNQVIADIASSLKLDKEFKLTDEILEDIKNNDGAISKLLDTFIEAHKEWYYFHLEIETKNKQGALSPDETSRLVNLIKKKEKSREDLLQSRNIILGK